MKILLSAPRQGVQWETVIKFALRFDKSEIEHWASRYSYPGESYIVDTLAPRVRAAGFYSKPDFLALCEWKSTRIRKHVAKNTDSFPRRNTGSPHDQP